MWFENTARPRRDDRRRPLRRIRRVISQREPQFGAPLVFVILDAVTAWLVD